MPRKLEIVIMIITFFFSFPALSMEGLITNFVHPDIHFVGRGETLIEIEDTYKDTGIVVLYGVSGIGKTQISRAYLAMNKNVYDIIWVFDSSKALKEQYKSFANQINTGYCEKKNRCHIDMNSEVVNNLKSFLENENLKWLLVYDNFQDREETMFDYLPLVDTKSQKRALVLSREKEGLGKLINVPLFSEKESIDLLSKYLPTIDQQVLQNIAQKLNHYPIGLTSVAKILGQNQILAKIPSEEEFIEALTSRIENHLILKNVINRVLSNYDDQQSLAKILTYCIIFNSHNIDVEFLKYIYQDEAQKSLFDTLAFLEKAAIIKRKKQEGGGKVFFEVHDYIKQILHDYLPIETLVKESIHLTTSLNLKLTDVEEDMDETYQRFENLLGDLNELRLSLLDLKIENLEMVKLNIFLLNYYVQYVYQSEAEKLYREIDESLKCNIVFEKELKSTFLFPLFLVNKAYIQSVTNRKVEAIQNYNQAIQANQIMPEQKRLAYRIYIELAQVHLHSGDVRSALKYIKIAAMYGKNVSTSYMGQFHYIFARVHKEQGDYIKANKEIDLGIASDKKYFAVSQFTLLSEVLKAEILIRLGKYSSAKQILDDIQKKYISVVKQYPPLHIRYLNIRVMSALHEEEYKIAQEAIVEITKIIAREKGSSEVDKELEAQVAITEGDYYLAMGELEHAVQCYHNSLGVYREIFIEFDNDTISMLLYHLVLSNLMNNDRYSAVLYKNVHESIMGLKHNRNKLIANLLYSWSD